MFRRTKGRVTSKIHKRALVDVQVNNIEDIFVEFLKLIKHGILLVIEANVLV